MWSMGRDWIRYIVGGIVLGDVICQHRLIVITHHGEESVQNDLPGTL